MNAHEEYAMQIMRGRMLGYERDRTALRSELASIAIMLQDRGRLPDPGGANFALVAGAVLQYVLEMELAVVALNEDRKGLFEGLLQCDDDCYHAPMCPRWEGHDQANLAPWGFAGEDPVEP